MKKYTEFIKEQVYNQPFLPHQPEYLSRNKFSDILEDFKNRVVLIKENTQHQNWPNSYTFNAIVERFDY